MFKSKIAENILAEHLINNGAVSFLTERPMRLKSGLITPIYVDNRRLTAVPEAWRDILETMATKVVELGLEFDIVAGVEGAGVSHAAALAYRLNKPSIFVRQAAKTYGNKSRVEGCDIAGKRVLLIETTSPPASRSSPPRRPQLTRHGHRTPSPSPPSSSTRPTSSSKSSKSAATK